MSKDLHDSRRVSLFPRNSSKFVIAFGFLPKRDFSVGSPCTMTSGDTVGLGNADVFNGRFSGTFGWLELVSPPLQPALLSRASSKVVGGGGSGELVSPPLLVLFS